MGGNWGKKGDNNVGCRQRGKMAVLLHYMYFIMVSYLLGCSIAILALLWELKCQPEITFVYLERLNEAMKEKGTRGVRLFFSINLSMDKYDSYLLIFSGHINYQKVLFV